jgi:predicted AAA+ superfamily ATPase
MLSRIIAGKLKEVIPRVPAVALLGPRQIGKTTLAQVVGNAHQALYLDLESPEDLLKLRDPLSFFSIHSDKLIILDEIQRMPDLFMILRGVIDKNRQSGRRGEQFLLLGSASMDLMRQSSESLAGRIHYLNMSGLNILEASGDDNKLWLRGGFPDSYLADSDSHAMQWLEMLIRTYLERDVPQLGFRIPANRLRRLWTMLAHLQGENINYSKLASNLEVDGKTVTHYLEVLVDLLLVRRLEPWHINVKKRLVKSPRFYIRDSGILHRLLGIHDHGALLSNPVLGKSWEGYVMENILSILPSSVEPYYYRTSAGAEIDLVLKISSTELWAIEIKYGMAPKIKQGFHQASADIQASHKFVVYGGEDEFPIERQTTMISLEKLMHKLLEACP